MESRSRYLEKKITILNSPPTKTTAIRLNEKFDQIADGGSTYPLNPTKDNTASNLLPDS